MSSCEHCGLSFKRRYHLKRHMESIHNEHVSWLVRKPQGQRYKCYQCSKGFPTPSKLAIHQSVHQDKTFICLDCSFTCNEKFDFQQHQSLKHPPTCLVCNATFTKQSSLIQHFKLHDRQATVCPICQKSFSSLKTLKFHSKAVHKIGSVKLYSCKSCAYTSCYKATVDRHIRKCVGKVESDTEAVILDDNAVVSDTEAVILDDNATSNKHDRTLRSNCGIAGLITGFDHPRAHINEKRKLACWVPNCFVNFTKAYDMQRHFIAVHASPP